MGQRDNKMKKEGKTISEGDHSDFQGSIFKIQTPFFLFPTSQILNYSFFPMGWAKNGREVHSFINSS